MKKLSLTVSVLLLMGMASTVSIADAGTLAQLAIVPSSTAAITVNTSNATTVNYTVTANAPVSNLHVIPSSQRYPIPNYITATLQSDTCTGSSLSPAGTCSFTVSLISQAGHAGQRFTLAPAVSGNGGATWSVPVAADRIAATVSAASTTYTVTPSGDGNESISPSTAQTVNSGATQSFTVTANSGYTLSNSAGGTCPAGSFSGSTYTTGAITGDCSVTFSATVNSPMLSANVTTALFSFNDASTTGSMGTGNSVITITNTGSAAASNVDGVTPLPSGVTESANTCGSSLAANASCQITFTTTTTPNSAQTISIKGTNTDTVSLPIAPLSIRVYSSPVNPAPSNASLMLVKTCTTPEQLLLTNNSASSVSSISITKDSGLSDVSVTSAMTNCPTTLTTGQSCVIGITAPSSSGSSNTQGNIIINWGSSSTGAVFTGIEATGATLPTLSIPTSPTTVFGGYVYQEDATCNLVKVAALADEYTGSGSVAWTTSSYYSTAVPNPATGSGKGAQNTGLAAGQINTTAVIYQAGTPLTSYAAGLCSQYVENNSGTNYVGWYLPWSDDQNASSSTSELAAMYTNLKSGQPDRTNGFSNEFYWSSSEFSRGLAFFRDFGMGSGAAASGLKNDTDFYVRCSRALVY